MMRKNLDEPQHISTFVNRGYARKLQDPQWQKLRLERMELSEWKCDECKDATSELQVHHNWYLKGLEPWEYDVRQLATLCDSCHKEATKLQDVLKLKLSYLRPSNQDVVRRFVSGDAAPCLLLRTGEPEDVNARVAKCYAIAVRSFPLLAFFLLEMHDDKGCLKVLSKNNLIQSAVEHIMWAWHQCGECQIEFYDSSGLYYQDDGGN